MTTTTATCPNCGTTITVEPAPVHCACCGRVIEGKPLCSLCEDAELVYRAMRRMGPSEVKGEG